MAAPATVGRRCEALRCKALAPRVLSTQELIGDEHDRSKDWKEAFAQHPDAGADVAALARQAPG